MTDKEIDVLAAPPGYEPYILDNQSEPQLVALSNVYSRLACLTDALANVIKYRRKGDEECVASWQRIAAFQYGKLPPWAKW